MRFGSAYIRLREGGLERIGLPQLGASGATLKRMAQDKLIEHKQYIDRRGQDTPEIRNWKWKG